MAKTKTETYKCKNCGHTSTSKFFKCPKCKEFGTPDLIESVESTGASRTSASISSDVLSKRRKLGDGEAINLQRFSTGISELDRVLGGGFVESEVVLLGGSPGAGKSTLSLSIADSFAKSGQKVLYCSGEESVSQISLRADRMSVSSDNIELVNTSSLEEIMGHIEDYKPDLFIVDSLQTVASTAASGSIGSISQSKEAAHTLNAIAKSTKTRAILVSQATKGDDYAGSLSIQHITDVSLVFETSKESPIRYLRTLKNRFGSIDEVGLFQHAENGLQEITDPSGLLMDQSDDALPGIAYSIVSEGIRNIPIEVQSLVVKSALPNPRKQFSGVSVQRGSIICAALDKYCKLLLGSEYDVYVSTIFGSDLRDPLSDLSVAASILSSQKDLSLKKRIAYIGEISLSGQIRGTHFIKSKVAEAKRMGFDLIVIPNAARDEIKEDGKIKFISSLSELLPLLKEES